MNARLTGARRFSGAVAAAGALIAVTVVTRAQEPADFSAARFRSHVEFLADDLLEGREAGTRGHEIAARYIATQFEQLGMKPAAPGGGYFEPVELQEWTPSGTGAVIKVSYSGGTRTLRDGIDALVEGPRSGGTARVSGALVFVGYGMSDPALGHDDYQGLDVRGKIVVALWALLPGVDSEIAAHALTLQKKVAADHGAIGFIAIETRSSARTFPFKVVLEMQRGPHTTWVNGKGQPDNPAPGIKLSGQVSPDASSLLFAGAPRTLDQVLDEADTPGGWPAGFAMKATAEISATTRTRRYTSPDVVGMIEGSDPVLKQQYVLLMAHADHIGISPSGEGGDRINNGALDNAAGVATLLEVTRALTMARQRPKRSILVVANTAEEKGLLGAEYLAHNPPVPVDRIVAAIDMDMPLLLYDFTDVVAYGGSHSTLDRAFNAAGAQMGVQLSPDPIPEQAIFVRSDHYPLAKVGVPAVMLATGMANGGQAAWTSFLQTQYHHPNDDLSLPIHWQSGARFAELNYRAISILADAPEAPRWYAGDYFGDRFAPNAPKAPRP